MRVNFHSHTQNQYKLQLLCATVTDAVMVITTLGSKLP